MRSMRGTHDDLAEMSLTATTTGPVSAGDIFQLLRDGSPHTRSGLASATGLARSTIASRVDSLLASGLVAPVADALSSGGRPPSQFALNPASRVIIAVDVGAGHCTVALTDLACGIIDSRSRDLDVAAGPEYVLTWVVNTARDLLAENSRSPSELAGVGIGLPGPVEHTTGRPISPPIMPGWDGFDVPGFVRRTLDAPVLVDNDVNIMALGEQRSEWPEHENLVFVKASTGIGAGIISGGRLQRGAVGAAGDIGHVQVPSADSVLCRCGNSGCLEAVVGGPALAATLRMHGVEAESTQDIVTLARAGDAVAIAAVRQAGRDIGAVLATCVNILNPSIIVVGGGLAMAGEHLLAGIREIVYQRSLPLSTADLMIVASRALDSAATLGAGSLVISHVLGTEAVEQYLATPTS
jgi:predicted NBD/HSP70 family sugar kinase